MEIIRSSTKVLNGEVAAAYGASLINAAIADKGVPPPPPHTPNHKSSW